MERIRVWESGARRRKSGQTTIQEGPKMKSAQPLSKISFLNSVVMAFLLALATGCSTKFSHPPAPKVAATPDYKYVIGPGDAVTVIVWRNNDLTYSAPVRPDGKISFPLVEDLPAIGKNPTTLARDVEKALSKYIRDPVVTVVVTGFVGPYSEQIRVVGEASKPQALPYRQNMTLLDVMIAVGGITDFADGNRTTLVRPDPAGNKLYTVKLKDLLRRGDISANVDMKPGDVLVIPQGWF
jgi:polysaccharide export outer membrane protein